jgi:rare lipoprotein A
LSTRGAIRGALAAVVAAASALPAAAAAESNGGQAAPAPGSAPTAGDGDGDPGVKFTTRRALFVGRGVRVRGSARSGAGRAIRIERRAATGVWEPVGLAEADREGSFRLRWVPERSGRYELRAVVADSAESAGSGSAARASSPRAVTVYRRARATWFGPGFYGKRTACGIVLRRSTVGVAHRRLPCGTKVAVTYRGRSLVVPVVDRGPYRRGVQYDLTGAAARLLGVVVTSRIGALPLTKTH